MNYPQDKNYFSRTGKSNWKKPLMIVVAVIVLYLWGSALFVESLSFITYPLLKVTGNIKENFSDSLKSQKDLINENKKLFTANENLLAEKKYFDELRAENLSLRGLLADTPRESNEVLAKVLVKPNHLPYDEIIIDLGSKTFPNLKLGQLIFANREIVLGRIEEISLHHSKVALYSTGGVKIPVVVGQTKTPSIAEGLGAGNFSLTLPRGVNIRVGDAVRTSIIGDYLLGYVADVTKEQNDPFQKIIFRSPYNVFELEWVRLFYD